MSASGMQSASLRLSRAETTRLARAIVFSLVLHLLCLGIYYAGKKTRLWERIQWPKLPLLSALMQKPQQPKQPPPVQEDMPLVFISVSPEQETVEPPKNAPYYAARNSRAANPEPEKDTNTPRITGDEERLIRTQDVTREQFQPLQPVKQAAVAPQDQEEAKPEPQPKPGDMQIAKADPAPKPEPDPGQAKESRPRTIKEALARKSGSQLPGRKMRQEGGVRQRLDIASLDAKGTAFGAYDQALVEAISARWFDLLYDRDYASDSRGRVVLQFKLHYDGRITDMRVAENTAGEVLGLICQKAVMDPAPFAPWPSDMRRLAGESRSIQFTFYYN